MLILLPPSEGKASPSGVSCLDLDSLAFAEYLSPKRAELIAALEKLGKAPEKKGIEALGISKGQAGDIGRDAELLSSPVAPASKVYTGVLYDRLGLDSLPAAGKRRAAKNLLISTNDESGNALTGDALTQKKALADKLEAELEGITDKTALEKRSACQTTQRRHQARSGF